MTCWSTASQQGCCNGRKCTTHPVATKHFEQLKGRLQARLSYECKQSALSVKFLPVTFQLEQQVCPSWRQASPGRQHCNDY